MKPYRHGLFIGKFYPPHLGHHQVIRDAEKRCDRVTVVVMATVAETIDLADRVAWLRAEHAGTPEVRVVGVRCDAPLDLGDEQVWTAQVAVMRAAIRAAANSEAAVPAENGEGDDPVDAVFSADGYGHELARRFGAVFVTFGRSLSSTAIRGDLPGTWGHLAPATRAGLTTRVVVVGAESTGTTTVSQHLARHYREIWPTTQWVGEYGRDYTYLKWDAEKASARESGRKEPGLDDITWTADDFDQVAREQTAAEERAARAGSPVLICDTDAFATMIWERRYLGAAARPDPEWARVPRRHLYLLTDHHDVPWTDDGLREGDLAIRAAMTDWFADALTAAGHSWVLLTGSEEGRTRLAIRTVDQMLTYRLRFGPPLQGPGFGPGAPSRG